MSGFNENSEEDPLSSSDDDENEKTIVLRENTELIERNEEDGESPFIVALAPRVGLMEDSHLEVSASPAFHELDMVS